jgi:RNA polymerase sigma factor (sigma-70 family)
VDLVRALRALPRRQREVVALRYLADRPEAEVADLLGCSAGAVKQHAHRGLAALRARLAPGAGGDDDDEEDARVRASR